MTRSIIAGLGFVVLIAMSGVAFGAETTVAGHLRDSFCFLTMGTHGPSHHDCAVACAKAGIPVMLER